MAGSTDIFAQVRSAVDLVEIIGEHVALKRAGREFKGLCPFHEDHRPSMSIVPHKQIFYCFVCGTGGDVFKFMELYHKMGKGEALRSLAQRAGIKLPELPGRGRGEGKDKQGLSPRERIAATNEWACGFFEKMLRTPAGKMGLDYLRRRGLTDETIARFRLGFAPDSWTGLVNEAFRAQSAALSPQHLSEAGLIKQRADSSPYDAFRNRVIFPIIDATGGGGTGKGGRVIAFGGRVLEEKRDEAGEVVEAKYLNSPETRLFNKSESLYGMNLARQQIVRTRTAVVVEGYMDVIACHQAGVSHVIATLGTALTPEHARILKNYAQTIILVFDSDDAGRRAADRAMEVFVRSQLDVKIAAVPDGKDPCDFCMKHGERGGAEFEKVLEKAADAMTYKWQALQAHFHGTDSLTARQESANTFLRFVAAAMGGAGAGWGGGGQAAMDPVRRGLLLAKVAGLVAMPVADVQRLLEKMAESSGGGGETRAARNGEASQAEPARAQRPRVNIKEIKGLAAAEGWLIGALLVKPAVYGRFRDEISLALFETFRELAEQLLDFWENASDLENCTLADLTTMLEERGAAEGEQDAGPDTQEFIREAIELEARMSDWLDPSSLSPQHVKLMQQLGADRGLSLESLAADALAELRRRRGGESAEAAGADVGVEEDQLESLRALVAKRAARADLRNTNFPV